MSFFENVVFRCGDRRLPEACINRTLKRRVVVNRKPASYALWAMFVSLFLPAMLAAAQLDPAGWKLSGPNAATLKNAIEAARTQASAVAATYLPTYE